MKKLSFSIFVVLLLIINFAIDAKELIPELETFLDSEGKSYFCDEFRAVVTTIEECKKCGNRLATHVGNDLCFCIPCGAPDEENTSKEACDICSNREYVNGKCSLKKCKKDEFYDFSNSRCISCFESNTIRAKSAECQKCPNRIMNGEYCILKDCPEGELHFPYMPPYFSTCFPCTKNMSWKTTTEECDRCQGIRKMYGENCGLTTCPADTFLNSIGECHSCSEDMIPDTTQEQCSKCPDHMYAKEWNKCIVCSYTGNPGNAGTFSENECSKCPNRTFKAERCFLSRCEDGFYRGLSGECYSCLDEGHGLTTEYGCKKCPNRDILGNRCLLRCLENEFLGENFSEKHSKLNGYNGHCISCSDTKIILTNLEQCSRCPNREYVDGKCILTKEEK